MESDAPRWEDWDAGHLCDCRYVGRSDGQVVGWAALSPVSGRCIYSGVTEVSVYVAEAARGQGAGLARVVGGDAYADRARTRNRTVGAVAGGYLSRFRYTAIR